MSGNKKTICFDLDDTICYLTTKPEKWEDYANCQPIYHSIRVVNELKNRGHKVIIYTARGMGFFQKDVGLINVFLRPLTEEWLRVNNVQYDELHFGKLHYDIWIDDKAMNADLLEEPDQIERKIAQYASSMYHPR